MTVALITLGFLLANALFVAAEFAIIGVSQGRRSRTSREPGRLDGRARARPADVAGATGPFIATAQLGITLASLGLGMYGEHTFAAWLEPRLDLSPTAALDRGAHAGQRARGRRRSRICTSFSARWCRRPSRCRTPSGPCGSSTGRCSRTLLLFYPFVTALNAPGNFCLRLIGIDRKEGPAITVYTPEELQIIVEESAEGGAMRAESGTILRELLEFGDLHRRRSDGAARARRGHSGRRHAGSACARSSSRTITRAIPSTTATSITSSACCT